MISDTAYEALMIENVDLKKRIEELESALKPFADAVYNDNGDVTITPPRDLEGCCMKAKRLLEQN